MGHPDVRAGNVCRNSRIVAPVCSQVGWRPIRSLAARLMRQKFPVIPKKFPEAGRQSLHVLGRYQKSIPPRGNNFSSRTAGGGQGNQPVIHAFQVYQGQSFHVRGHRQNMALTEAGNQIFSQQYTGQANLVAQSQLTYQFIDFAGILRVGGQTAGNG